MSVAILVFDSVTKLPPEADGAVVIGGSHAAIYAAHMSAKFGCRAAIHHDAGIGKDEAGIGGLAYADKLGMAMAAVATASARIGDGADLHARGVISRANALAISCGVVPGMSARHAAELLKAAPWPHALPATKGESRYTVEGVVCADSATLLVPEDRGRVVATGSHGAPNSAMATAPFRPLLLMFNDAGRTRQGGHRRHRSRSAVGAHRRRALHVAGRNDFRRQRGRIPARRAFGRLRACTGARTGRESWIDLKRESLRAWPSSM